MKFDEVLARYNGQVSDIRVMGASVRLLAWIRRAEFSTRPVHPDTRAALARRWAALPPSRRPVPRTTLGRLC